MRSKPGSKSKKMRMIKETDGEGVTHFKMIWGENTKESNSNEMMHSNMSSMTKLQIKIASDRPALPAINRTQSQKM